MKSLSFRATATSILSLLLAAAVLAQQPASRKRVPMLTTEDVLRDKAQPPSEVAGEEKLADGDAKSTAASGKSGGEKVSPEEAAWRENLQNARQRAKEAERAAEEGELLITDLRNRLASSGQTTRERNQTAADLDAAGERLIELKRHAKAAADDLQKLLDYGREKRFTEAADPKPQGGKSSEDYYRQRYAKLSEKLQTAERRVQLYENRLRDMNQRIQTNAVSGDNFYIAQLQQERDEAQDKLDEASQAREQAQADIDALKAEARRAGVAPGVFR